jgi:hypothetical protein
MFEIIANMFWPILQSAHEGAGFFGQLLHRTGRKT